MGRDDKQLAGQLITNSSSCGNYTYVNTTSGMKLIAPCGALADAMFNALQDYAKPINWKNNVTMLDEDHPQNNGFQRILRNVTAVVGKSSSVLSASGQIISHVILVLPF
ncbi:hypothetical protein HF086_006741 [Spodoptera exigua]|uniref:Uncharacterized protein n=1 Tax=Spodoptera exigua TaxID=7107 RepID=A0A922M715_SPOEX|nr:hypothetical protein HF086_006741 [Spodoptera exigua]